MLDIVYSPDCRLKDPGPSEIGVAGCTAIVNVPLETFPALSVASTLIVCRRSHSYGRRFSAFFCSRDFPVEQDPLGALTSCPSMNTAIDFTPELGVVPVVVASAFKVYSPLPICPPG